MTDTHLKPEPVAWLTRERFGDNYRYTEKAPHSPHAIGLYTQGQLDAAVRAERERLKPILEELYGDQVWNAYNTGIVTQDGMWIDAGMKDAELLRYELHLAPTPQPADVLRAALPKLIQRLVAAAIREGE